jgi:predicted phage-related endonuclease
MKRYRDGDFPMEYYCQCLHYLAVTGWDAWYLAVLVYGTDLLVFKICREEAQGDIDALVAAEERFWLDYIEGSSIPPTDALPTTGAAIERVWSDSSDYVLDAYNEDEDWIGQLIDAKARKRALDEEIRGLENKIKARMQDAQELRSTQALITWRPQKTRRISERLIRERYPEVDLDSIRETTETRRFGVRSDGEYD